MNSEVPYVSSFLFVLITECLNGNITMEQGNKTIVGEYVSSMNETKLIIDMHKGDYDFIMKNATSISTYWFIDCKYYGQTNDFTFAYNFTSPDTMHEIGALVIASYAPLITTTTAPPTTTTTVVPANVTTIASNTTTTNPNGTVTTTSSPTTVTTIKPTTVKPTTTTAAILTNASAIDAANMSLPYICSNASLILPNPNNTYGYFQKKINIRG